MRPSVNTPSQSIRTTLMRAARRSISASSYIVSLLHLEEFNAGELPSAAHTLEDERGRAGLVPPELSHVDCDIGGQTIRVQLLCADNLGGPAFGLAADDA